MAQTLRVDLPAGLPQGDVDELAGLGPGQLELGGRAAGRLHSRVELCARLGLGAREQLSELGGVSLAQLLELGFECAQLLTERCIGLRRMMKSPGTNPGSTDDLTLGVREECEVDRTPRNAGPTADPTTRPHPL